MKGHRINKMEEEKKRENMENMYLEARKINVMIITCRVQKKKEITKIDCIYVEMFRQNGKTQV